jgi:hypothetical protein
MIELVGRYNYSTIKRFTNQHGVRYYVDPDHGTRLPSVTTILGATADQSSLLKWRQWVGDDEADRVRKEAIDLGTMMHTHLESHVAGIPRPRGTNLVRQMAKRMSDIIIARGLTHVSEVWGLEVALHAPGLYAGTTDLVGLYDGVPAIMDYKTTAKMKARTSQTVQDYMCQASAYALAHNERFGTDIRTSVVFMVDRSDKFQSFVLNGPAFDEAAERWGQRMVDYLRIVQERGTSLGASLGTSLT